MDKFKTGLIKKAILVFHVTVSLSVASVVYAESLKIGVVSFFSGGVSGPVGIPSRNGGDLIIKAINEGTLPAPYSGVGAGGRLIEAVYSDEAVDSATRVTEYRNLVQRQGVDAVVGYASSGSCLAIAPVAEELKALTLFYYCGSTRIFEEAKRKYVFRTMATQDVENIAAARYVSELFPNAKSVSGMNQNYAWGQDSWRDFQLSLKKFSADINIATEQFPKIFAGQYGAEITALGRAGADIIHSSFWGGDMEAFILQGNARNLFEDQTVLLTTGGTSIKKLAKQIAEGTIIGARGSGDMFAPDTNLNRWFRKAYEATYGETPTFPAYYMAQAILALKAAADKSGKNPSIDQIRSNLINLTYESPAGTIRMRRSSGHQAITGVSYGQFTLVDGKASLKNVRHYSPDCVNPPAEYSSLEWIKAGFPGAQCN